MFGGSTKKPIIVYFNHQKYFLPIRLSLQQPHSYEQFPIQPLTAMEKQFNKLVQQSLILSPQERDLIIHLSSIMKNVLIKQFHIFQQIILIKQKENYKTFQSNQQSKIKVSESLKYNNELLYMHQNYIMGQKSADHFQFLRKHIKQQRQKCQTLSHSLNKWIKLLINFKNYIQRQKQVVIQLLRLLVQSKFLDDLIQCSQGLILNQIDKINHNFSKRGNDFDTDMQIIHSNNEKADIIKFLLIKIVNIVMNRTMITQLDINENNKSNTKNDHIKQRVSYFIILSIKIQSIMKTNTISSSNFVKQLIQIINRSKEILKQQQKTKQKKQEEQSSKTKHQQENKNHNDFIHKKPSKKFTINNNNNQLKHKNILVYKFKTTNQNIKVQSSPLITSKISITLLQILLKGILYQQNLITISTILSYIDQTLQEIQVINDLLNFTSACMSVKFYQNLQKIQLKIKQKQYLVQNCKLVQINYKFYHHINNGNINIKNNIQQDKEDISNNSIRYNNNNNTNLKKTTKTLLSSILGKNNKTDQNRIFTYTQNTQKDFLALYKYTYKTIQKLKQVFLKLKSGKINFQKYHPSAQKLSAQIQIYHVHQQKIRKASIQSNNSNQDNISGISQKYHEYKLNNDQQQIFKILTQNLSNKIDIQAQQIQQLKKQLKSKQITIKNLTQKLNQKQFKIHNLEKVVGQYINAGNHQQYFKNKQKNKNKLHKNVFHYKILNKIENPQQNSILSNTHANFNTNGNNNANINLNINTTRNITSSVNNINANKAFDSPPSLAETLKMLNQKNQEKKNDINQSNIFDKNIKLLPPNLPIPPPLNLPINLPIPPPFTLGIGLNQPHHLNKKITPTKKHGNQVKTIGWSVVQPYQIKDSFWQQISDTQIDQDEIVKNFSKKQKRISQGRNSSQMSKLQNINKKTVQLKSLISKDRAKNIQIVLTKFRIDPRNIQDIVINFDQRYFNEQKIQCLLNILPTQKEYEIFGSVQIIQEQASQWSIADFYLYTAVRLQSYQQRLKAILFKYEFQKLKNDFNQKSKYFVAYFSGLLKDPLLKLFMKYLLNIGNYLNVNSFRGTAHGIKLDSIQKTYTFLGQDTSVTLFQYVMSCVWKNEINQTQDQPLIKLQPQSQPEQNLNRRQNEQTKKKKKINLREQIYKVYNSSIQYPVIGLKGISQEMKSFEKQFQNIEQCLVNIQLQKPNLKQIQGSVSQSEFLKKQFESCKDKVTQYLLPFYVRLQEEMTIMKQQLNDAKQALNKFQTFYCDKTQSQKVMQIIKKFRNRVRQYINKKNKQNSLLASKNSFNQFQFLNPRGRFSLVNSSQ